jgi:hypothetical protein
MKKKSSRRKRALRMLEHAVRLAVPLANSGMSGTEIGRLALVLRKDVSLLKALLKDDPDDEFWETLQKAILRLVKVVRDTKC